MSRAITFNEDIKAKILAEVAAKLENYKSSDGKFNFSTTIVGESKDDEISISITPDAYLKMISLVGEFTSEVAWHGTVERDGNHFRITDIIVYPQSVTGVTVTTDEVQYVDWLYGLEDEVFNSLRFQGHSHVNMAVSPSSTDLEHQKGTLSKLTNDDFYIFVIWNKRGDYNFRVYDLATNTMYENSDINFYVEDFDYDLFVADAKKMVKAHEYKPSFAATSQYWRKGYSYDKKLGCYVKDEPKKTSESKLELEDEYDSAFDYAENDRDAYRYFNNEGWY